MNKSKEARHPKVSGLFVKIRCKLSCTIWYGLLPVTSYSAVQCSLLEQVAPQGFRNSLEQVAPQGFRNSLGPGTDAQSLTFSH